MLRKLMSSIVIGTIVLGMVGCSNPETNSNGAESRTKVEEKVEKPVKQEKQQESTKKANKKEDDKKSTTNKGEKLYTTEDGRKLTAEEYGEYLKSDEYLYGKYAWLETCPACGKNARIESNGSLLCGRCGYYIYELYTHCPDCGEWWKDSHACPVSNPTYDPETSDENYYYEEDEVESSTIKGYGSYMDENSNPDEFEEHDDEYYE